MPCAIAERPVDWRRATSGKAFRSRYELGGERLVRPPRGFSADAEHIEDLKRKDFIAVCALADREVLAKDFAKQAYQQFAAAKPLMAFLCKALNLQF